MTTTMPATAGSRIAPGSIVRSGALAALVAAVINGVIYLIGEAAGLFPDSVQLPNGGGSLTLLPVIFASVVGAILATVAFFVVSRISRRPRVVFRIVAAVALVLSFASPLGIADAPLKMVLTLELMHIVTAAAAVWMLTVRGAGR